MILLATSVMLHILYKNNFINYHDIDKIVSQVFKEIEKQIDNEFNMVVKYYKKSLTKDAFILW